MSQGKGDTRRPGNDVAFRSEYDRIFPPSGGDPFSEAQLAAFACIRKSAGRRYAERLEQRRAAQQEVDDARARLQRAKDADAAFLRRLTGGG